ncbi:hypothetical protein FHX42_002056 [Saccharopolyspora lacisalsi]|uniref:Uncharacterized protein n=1 Tax=Halosaccharopolyspora lacisalsi TaxID=1000566 RepID=A0A839DVC1_9PSEU|nr:hypothetical protein [Halosaccharopolyspora lacisalsi]MBA8824709.1 hypothetical protein [Halosaccharopolyspora lacisalsi]
MLGGEDGAEFGETLLVGVFEELTVFGGLATSFITVILVAPTERVDFVTVTMRVLGELLPQTRGVGFGIGGTLLGAGALLIGFGGTTTSLLDLLCGLGPNALEFLLLSLTGFGQQTLSLGTNLTNFGFGGNASLFQGLPGLTMGLGEILLGLSTHVGGVLLGRPGLFTSLLSDGFGVLGAPAGGLGGLLGLHTGRLFLGELGTSSRGGSLFGGHTFLGLVEVTLIFTSCGRDLALGGIHVPDLREQGDVVGQPRR